MVERLSPSFASIVDAASGCGSHGVEPPAFFRLESTPVAKRLADDCAVGSFHGPGQDDQLLAQEAFYLVLPDMPSAGSQVLFSQSPIELPLDRFRQRRPDGAWKRASLHQFVADLRPDAVVLGDEHWALAVGWDIHHEMMRVYHVGASETDG